MVAVQFDRSLFSCTVCEKAERAGGDLRAQNSGTKGSCDGPREWTWFRGHPSGGFSWRGCPRKACDLRTDAWVSLYDRCDGKLSYTEARRAPMLLLEAFQTIDYVRALQAWDERQRLEAERRALGVK